MTRALPILLFFLGSIAWCQSSSAPQTWQGWMGQGSHRVRVAFVLKGTQGEYHNIDDGIHGEPMTLEVSPSGGLTAQTQGGGTLRLDAPAIPGLRTGSFDQAPRGDGEKSLMSLCPACPVTLREGEDFLVPRTPTDAKQEPHYAPPDPSEGWEGQDLRRLGVDTKALEGVVKQVLGGKYPRIHGLLLVHGGKLGWEEYFYGYGPQDPHPVQSITKSLFSLLVGIGEERGFLRTDQGLFDLFPEARKAPGWDPRKEGITLRSLLTMTSGLGCDDFKDSTGCSWAMVRSSDWVGFTLALPLAHAPESHFAYCGACLMPLAALLEGKSGQELSRFAQKGLFLPLGIEDTSWWEGPGGVHSPAFGLSLRPRDLAKIGVMVLNGGTWKGSRIVPEKWLAESFQPQVLAHGTHEGADYGYLWWERNLRWGGRSLRVLDAWGVGGQHLFIVPALDLVLVMTGGNYRDSALSRNNLRMLKDILAACPLSFLK